MSEFTNTGALVERIESFTTSGSPIVLTIESPTFLYLTGVTAQTIVLPDATTSLNGMRFVIINQSSQDATLQYDDLTTADTVAAGSEREARLVDNSTPNGTWAFSGGGSGGVDLINGGLETEVDTTDVSYTVLTNKVHFHPFMHVVTGHTITVNNGGRLLTADDTIDGTVIIDPGGIWKVL